MPHQIQITLPQDFLEILAATGEITIRIDSAPAASGRRKSPSKHGGAANAPRPGSLPDRVSAWAAKRGKTFGVADVEKKFKIKKAHAAMVLSTMVRRSLVRRTGRGIYAA